MLMTDGMITSTGKINDVINTYSIGSSDHLSSNYKIVNMNAEKEVELVEAIILNKEGIPGEYYDISEPVCVKVKIYCKENQPTLFCYIRVSNSYGETIIESDTHDFSPNIIENIQPGVNWYELTIAPYTLAHGEYVINFCLAVDYGPKPHIDNAGVILKLVSAPQATVTARPPARIAISG